MGDNTFSDTISNLLKDGNTVQALTLFTDNKNVTEVCNNSWDLVPIVAHYLSEVHEDNNIEVFKCCQKLLSIIAERSKAGDVLLQFIEEIEAAKDDVKFLTLLRPLETVLLRVPDKRITSLGWCFNAIRSYLEKVDIPDDMNLLEEERLLLDTNESVNRIHNLYQELLVFCDTFVQELLKLSKDASGIKERKQIIAKFLIELMGKPLSCLDMDVYKKTKPKARIVAEKLTENLSYIVYDPYSFLELRDNDYGSDLVKPNSHSLGILYYLMMCEGVGMNKAPKVYDSVYIFHSTLVFVNTLLTQDSQFVVEKGVHLAEVILKSINNLELSYLLLDAEHHSKFCKTISNVIIHNGNETIRKKSLQIFQKYLWSFEHQGRYLIILNVLRILSHSGLKGNIITQYKEMITREIRRCGGSQTISKYYKGRKLFNLLDEFTLLKNKEETDLVDESDQIVSTLNFLRYLVIVDKLDDIGICSYLDTLEEGYFKYLKTGIQMSKGHYRLKVKEVNDEREKGSDSDCEVSVNVSGKYLGEISKEQKIEIMNLSLTTLDVIDSLLNRVIECINLKKIRL